MNRTRRCLVVLLLVLVGCGERPPLVSLGAPPRWIALGPDGCLEYDQYETLTGVLKSERRCPGSARNGLLPLAIGAAVASPGGPSKFISVAFIELLPGMTVRSVRGTFGGQMSVLGSFLILVKPNRVDFTIEGTYQGKNVSCPPEKLPGVIGVLGYRCTF